MIKKSAFGISLLVYGLLFLYLSPLEFTGDSYGYAAEILKNEHWNAHHLLHKYFLRDVLNIISPLGINIEPLTIFRLVHLLSAFASLLVLRAILLHRHWADTRIYLGILLVASSFVFIKYAFENEVYFYPILLSLIGSYQFEQGKRYRSAIWMGMATLFHQIHIFWLIGLLFPKNWKEYRSYFPLLFGLSIPITTYSLIGLIGHIPLSILLFQDVQAGLVQTIPDTKNVLFFGINLIRTWFQLHGDIGLIWKLWNPFYSGIAILMVIYVLLGIIIFLRERRFSYQASDWHQPYFVVLILQLLFALYSVGNIEFMVMIPFLIVLLLKNGSLLKHSLILSVGMLVWNWSQWSIPLSKWKLQRIETTIQKCQNIANFRQIQSSDKDDLIFFTTPNAALFQNYYEYQRLIGKYDTSESALLFVPNNSVDTLTEFFEIKHLHHRLNRSQLQYQQTNQPDDSTRQQRLLTYRDTGLSGVLEIWKVNPTITNLNK